ncbi:MAG: hypothetical protein WDZ68_02055, partial [Candidatus Paceibacterota bacterium]
MGGDLTVINSELAHNLNYGINHAAGKTTITESNIHDHIDYGVFNRTSESIDARHNYWGDPSGPFHYILNPTGTGNGVSDNVLFVPWKEELDCTESCHSNILFLPGIKGSILKRDRLIGSDTLWPPTVWSDDVEELALTEDGHSIHPVYVDGVIETFKTVSVYDGYVAFMDELVRDDTINAWKPMPYDWRLSLETVVDEGVKTAEGIVDIIAELEKLAESSRTNKVTIVAHSAGGLLGKALIKKLEEMDKDHLVDSFVMVGTPQIGTPQAIASLLHGDNEGIPGSFPSLLSVLNNSIVEPSAARAVAQNMPSVHTLLPSEKYFTEVIDPVVTFDENTASTQAWRNIWGSEIDTYGELVSFLTGAGDGRTDPPVDELKLPAVLDSSIISQAEAFHTKYDAYVFPEHIRVVQIAGWGMPTMKAVRYTEAHGEPDYRPVFTVEGDRTVVNTSVTFEEDNESYYLDLSLYNADDNDAGHKDLLNTSSVQSLLLTIVRNMVQSDIDYITTMKPNIEDIDEQLLVSVHSPVILGVYDQEGNFTGIDRENERIIEDIPGSSFQIFGQSQYMFVPREGIYEFEYVGTGAGPTTVEIAAFSDDTESVIVRYSDMETTTETETIFTVDGTTPEESLILVDIDGDGAVDDEVYPDGTATDTDDYETFEEL